MSVANWDSDMKIEKNLAVTVSVKMSLPHGPIIRASVDLLPVVGVVGVIDQVKLFKEPARARAVYVS